MPAGNARSKTFCRFAVRAGYSCGLALAVFLFASRALQNAAADGDTRTISMHHVHTGEDITVTYMHEGRYDQAALKKLDWFLRDWRRGKAVAMDPHLIDLLWQVHRESGSKAPIYIVCGYRSPATNAMLRHRSRAVARSSQHMLGHAVDFYIPGAPLQEIRVIGLRMQRGGVGFYPTSGSSFVHMDTGGVRMWPRMTREQLLNVFPDGRTVYLPRDGRPLPGYQAAFAKLQQRGQKPDVTWAEEARAQGPNKNIVLVSDVQRRPAPIVAETYDMTADDSQADAREAVLQTTSPAPPAPSAAALAASADALRAALEREAARQRRAAHLAGHVAAASPIGVGLYDDAASLPAAPVPPPQHTRQSETPNQIIMARDYWPDTSGARSQTANGGIAADITGGVVTAGGQTNRATAAFVYSPAAPAQRTPTDSPVAPAAPASPAAAASPLPALPAATTIAIKRAPNQLASVILTAPTRDGADMPAQKRPANAYAGDSIWLSAMIMSPDITRDLTTLVLGEPDYRALAPLVKKPSSAVVMHFSAHPNAGITTDRFSGDAIVFLPTTQYGTATASLR